MHKETWAQEDRKVEAYTSSEKAPNINEWELETAESLLLWRKWLCVAEGKHDNTDIWTKFITEDTLELFFMYYIFGFCV